MRNVLFGITGSGGAESRRRDSSESNAYENQDRMRDKVRRDICGILEPPKPPRLLHYAPQRFHISVNSCEKCGGTVKMEEVFRADESAAWLKPFSHCGRGSSRDRRRR